MSEEMNGYGIDMSPISPLEIRISKEWLREFLFDFLEGLADVEDDSDINEFVDEWLKEYEV